MGGLWMMGLRMGLGYLVAIGTSLIVDWQYKKYGNKLLTPLSIAVAFVATIYGVAMANLICLPAAGKLKFRHREEQMIKEMMLEGVISILEGMNPRMIETKLRTYLFDSTAADSPRHSEVGA